MNDTTVRKELVGLVLGGVIETYSENGAERKEQFLKCSKRVAKQIATALELPEGSFESRTNRGGVAVSGDVHLHAEHLYVDFSQSALCFTHGFMYRGCKDRTDYGGEMGYPFQNRWCRWERLVTEWGAVIRDFRCCYREAQEEMIRRRNGRI